MWIPLAVAGLILFIVFILTDYQGGNEMIGIGRDGEAVAVLGLGTAIISTLMVSNPELGDVVRIEIRGASRQYVPGDKVDEVGNPHIVLYLANEQGIEALEQMACSARKAYRVLDLVCPDEPCFLGCKE